MAAIASCSAVGGSVGSERLRQEASEKAVTPGQAARDLLGRARGIGGGST